jgi:hypothetical protein
LEQNKEFKLNSLLYYHPDSEYLEYDKSKNRVFSNKIIMVTNKFIKYLVTVNRFVFNNKMVIFSEDHGVYKHMNKNDGKDKFLYELFIYYNFNVLFLCFFYWFLFVPVFFMSFMLRHLYFSSYGKIGGAYRFFCLIRSLLGDFAIVHNICKFVEGPYFIHR